MTDPAKTGAISDQLLAESRGMDHPARTGLIGAGSRIETEHTLGQAEPLLIDFTLAGTPYQILNGGPHFKLSEAASISVLAKDQAEIDRLWEALTATGGQESQCGWLKDRWGVSWQIYPQALIDMQSSPDKEAAKRTHEAMLKMGKIDIATLQEAFEGN